MENAAPLVTIIIVNYNGGAMIDHCLRDLIAQTYRNFQIVVVDNDSSDQSSLEILKKFPEVTVLFTGKNLGFAAGVNYALRNHILGTWIALVNPDAFPTPTWLEKLVSCALKNPHFTAFGSRMYSGTPMEFLDGTGDTYHISGFPKRANHGSKDADTYNEYKEIFAPCAAAALYKTSSVEALGGFDEDFFCYIEDVDFGFRMRLLGEKCMYVPDAKIIHLGSAITGKNSDFQIYHGQRNVIWTYIKNMPNPYFWLFLPLHVFANILAIIKHCSKGNTKTVFQAKFDAITKIPFFWKKRIFIQRNKKVTSWQVISACSWIFFNRPK